MPVTLPLVGYDLKAYNNVFTTPPKNPLGDIINALYAGGGGSSPWQVVGGTVSLIVAGNTIDLNLLTSPLKLNGAAGAAGQVLTSGGAGAAPTWTTPATGTIGGSIAATQIAFGTGANTIGGNTNFTWNNGSSLLNVNGSMYVGTASQFQVTSAGDLASIKSVPYSFPAAQGAASTVLTNDGAGNLSWATPPSPPAGPWQESSGVVSLTNLADTEVQMLLGGLAQPLTFNSGLIGGTKPFYWIRPAAGTDTRLTLSGAENPAGTGGEVVVAGGYASTGGAAILTGGDGSFAGGNMTVKSGQSTSGGSSGNVEVLTPLSTGTASGHILIQTGNSPTATGYIDILCAGNGGTGGHIDVKAGDGVGNGGDLTLWAGSSVGTNGNVVIRPGTGGGGAGTVTIGATPGSTIILGALDLKRDLQSNTNPGSAGQVLTSAGAGAVPTWSTPAVPWSANSVASASSVTIPQATLVTVTGGTQIDTFATASWSAGAHVTLLFSGAPLVKNTAAKLAGSVDFQAAADSVLGLVFDGTSWQETFRKVA